MRRFTLQVKNESRPTPTRNMPPRIFKKRFLLAAAAAVMVPYFYQAHAEVPVLMYHHVEPDIAGSSVHVSPLTFMRQMEFLKVHGYRVVPLERLVQKIKAKEPVPSKTVAITFDDGTLGIFKYAFPVLKKMDFPATIFMITRDIGQKGFLSEEDLRILDESGLAIGSHTVNHAFLPDLRDKNELLYEMDESKKVLEQILGHPVTLFSYPAGGVTAEAEALLEALGYEGAVTTNYAARRGDPYAIRRVKITEGKRSLFNFWLKVSGLYQVGKKRIEIKV